MFTIATLLGLFGIGAGVEGFDDGKLYLGIYAPHIEYGYVVTSSEIYLDTILEKK